MHEDRASLWLCSLTPRLQRVARSRATSGGDARATSEEPLSVAGQPLPRGRPRLVRCRGGSPHRTRASEMRSRHDDDDRCTRSSDKSPTQRTSHVVASLGRASNDEQIGAVGVRDPQKLSRCVPLGANERDVHTVVVTVRSHLIAQFLYSIGHRLLNGSVGDDCSGQRNRRGSRSGARSRTHEYCDRRGRRVALSRRKPSKRRPRTYRTRRSRQRPLFWRGQSRRRRNGHGIAAPAPFPLGVP